MFSAGGKYFWYGSLLLKQDTSNVKHFRENKLTFKLCDINIMSSPDH